jgi:hypothetical protein
MFAGNEAGVRAPAGHGRYRTIEPNCRESKKMSSDSINPISAEDRALWRRHNIADLLAYADLPLTRKIRMLEDMEEVARAFHKGKLPRSADEHEELRW